MKFEMEELKKRIEELDRLIGDYRGKRRVLQKELDEMQTEKLKEAVGMCFAGIGWYACIIDTPRAEICKTGAKYYQYQLPVIVVREGDQDVVTIEEDTLFSRAVDRKDVKKCLRDEYSEVPKEDFFEALERGFQKIRLAVGVKNESN